ncbi:MAG: LapA family protein [Proteobacteria bacterium]|nr:LapA family protein [Pseudomonadota bacterium]
MKTFKSVPLILLSILLVIISVANREPVTVSLWPFPIEISEVPLFFVFFAGIFVGLFLAGILLAFKGVRHYVDMRGARKEADKQSKEIDTLESELDKKPPKVEQKDYIESSPGQTRKLAKRNQAH